MEVPTSAAVVGIDNDKESDLLPSINSLWSGKVRSAWIVDDSPIDGLHQLEVAWENEV